MDVVKDDKGKVKLSLTPSQIIRDVALVREYGVKKYHDPDNWKKVELERYIDAFYRHWLAFVEDNHSVDAESGIEHYKHAACNMAFICELMKDRERPKVRCRAEDFDYEKPALEVSPLGSPNNIQKIEMPVRAKTYLDMVKEMYEERPRETIVCVECPSNFFEIEKGCKDFMHCIDCWSQVYNGEAWKSVSR